MSRLYVVRHGQARFFTDDYDRLSEKGEAQCAALARHWLEQGLEFHAAWCGSLVRQRRSGETVREVYREAGRDFPEIGCIPTLDEYPADDIMDTLLPLLRESVPSIDDLARAFEAARDDRERYRGFHRLLEAVMERWIARAYPDEGSEGLLPWDEFSGGVRAALRDIMADAGSGENVAVFTSGGPVGISVQTVLGAPDRAAAELNWRVHNGSVTCFTFSGSRVSLDCFNATDHLQAELLTYR
ncbi:histidine phosphatase family protein [Lentisalinibacter salinarum]|uniref:histidine phosphatase family protein n=1 Tax=Lentisalinibacter salinarum TaxID=2992239 RepID=UPI003870E6F4